MKYFILAAMAALQIGCAVKVVRDDAQVTGETKVYQINSFLWAFVPGRKLPSGPELCPGGQVQTLDLSMAASDVLLTVVTIGIYVPHQVQVTCLKN